MRSMVVLVVAVTCIAASGVLAGPAEVSKQAHQALSAGDTSLATSLFQEILADYPDSPEAPVAALRLANIGLRLGEPNVADLFMSVIQRYSSSTQAADALRRLGYLKQREGKLDEAQQFFKQAADHPAQTKTGKAESLVQYAFLDISKYFAAGLPGAPTCSGGSAVPADRKAEAAARMEEARKKLNEVASSLASDPSNAVYSSFVQAGIGETYIFEQKWTEAEQAYRAGLENYSGQPDKLLALLHHGLGIALRREKRPSEAVAEIDACLQYASSVDDSKLPWISAASIKADAVCVKAGILFEQRRFQEGLDALTSVLSDLMLNGDSGGDLRERVARVAMWRAILLHHLHRDSDRDSALQSIASTFPGTEAGGMAADTLANLQAAR